MAAHHFPENTTLARFDVVVLSQDALDYTFLLFVLGDGLTVNEQNPIQVAARRSFLPCHRSEHDKARVGRILPPEKFVEIMPHSGGIAARLTNRGLIGTKIGLKPVECGAIVRHEV